MNFRLSHVVYHFSVSDVEAHLSFPLNSWNLASKLQCSLHLLLIAYPHSQFLIPNSLLYKPLSLA